MNIDRIEITHSVVIDFIASIVRLVNKEEFMMEELGSDDFNAEITEWVNRTTTSLPLDTMEKLRTFYNLNEISLGFRMAKYIITDDIKDIWSYIRKVESLEAREILLNLVQWDAFATETPVTIKDIEKMCKNPKKALDFINNTLTISTGQKWDIIRFFIDPEGLKKDFVDLLKWYYLNIYVYQEDKAESFIKEYEELLLRKKEENDELFFLNFVRAGSYNDIPQEKINIAVSYFIEKNIYLLMLDSINQILSFTGYGYLEKKLSSPHSNEDILKIFRAIADDTRINIIKLLSKRPWYGAELAEELNMTAATISHHLSLLLQSKFIINERHDKKFYYKLNKEKIMEDTINALKNLIE